MATNLALDDKLIQSAVKLGKHKSKKDAVNAALEEYVQHRKQLRILDFAGKLDFWPGFDQKALRRRK